MTLSRTPTLPSAKKKRRHSRLRAAGQLFGYFAGTGRWWLIPLVVILGLATVILIGIKIAQYAAPFVYTLF